MATTRPSITEPDAELRCEVLNWFPGMDPELLATVALRGGEPRIDVLIIVTTAGGSIASDCAPVVERVCESGVSVVLLPDNYGSGHGILRLSDQPLVDALDAGAVGLQRANLYDLEAVIASLREGHRQGLSGRVLSNWIVEQYRFPDGQAPLSPLDMGTEGLRQFGQRLSATDLGGLPNSAGL